ncbi:hypothetical protein TKK_0013486 [Trichogramma kaykai]
MNRPSKRNKKVLNLVEKIKILDALKEGEKVAFLARRFNVNESTIRSIRNNESKIRESAKSLGKHAENCKISRSPLMEKMEDMLIIWLQDLMHKKIPIESELLDLVASTEVLSVDEIDAIVQNTEAEEEMIADEEPEPVLTAKVVGNILADAERLIERALNYDPIMTRSLQFRQDIEKSLECYKNLYKDLLRRAKQKSLTQYFTAK